MLEVMIWDDAFPEILFPHPWNIADCISKGRRPETINNIKQKEIVRLIEYCWCQHPKDRFTIDYVISMLETQYIQWED